jgi:adenine-specific DNA-methyltransferase
MDKLRMQTVNKADENFKRLAEMFPNAVTEAKDENGEIVRAIDKDVLMQEISCKVVDGNEERYQFTWPDKKKSVLLANAPINKTLRPVRDDETTPTGADSEGKPYCSSGSVNFDNTENLYIEGDNLEVLKLLQETYLGKIKMIYIDPPYNTGNDFVYADNFAQTSEEYFAVSGMYDDEGNRLFTNSDSNGRFHTNWLNMIYTRLKLAKDMLSDDGAIFIHIDEHEVYSLTMVCNEIFGQQNQLGTIIWDKRNPKGVVAGVAYQHESIIVYCKNIAIFAGVPFLKKKENADAMMRKVESLIQKYGMINDRVRTEYKKFLKDNKNNFTGGESAYSLIDNEGRIYQPVSMAAPDKPETRSHRPLIHPITGKPCPVPAKGWRFTDKTMDELVRIDKIEYGEDETTQPRQKYYLKDNMEEAVASLLYFGGSDDAMGLPFDNPKPVIVAQKLISTLCKNGDEIIMDFFSGSATTAHAVMQLNAEDGGHRKFIMVQIPEETDEKSEAYKAGYKNICEIGKERIRRAGQKILNECGVRSVESGVDNSKLQNSNSKLDIGFRVLKCDTSNMKDVYYNPAEYEPSLFSSLEDNIKEDRTPEDLLFQVMLDLGILLSSKIQVRSEKVGMRSYSYFDVEDGYLIACFDEDITDEVITEIAKQKPYYFVMRDSSMANDSVATNFEQIFATYSPDTTRKVL